MTADQIIDLLAEKHAKDVFVAECKNGQTWGGHRRLDAWAMRKSWSPWATIGYEVKVSRSDFEQDQKWTEYLPLCHEFSFVCPAGLIRAIDLPKGVGLIWVSATPRLHTKVKAGRRDVDTEQLAQLMSYVLMSRTRIVADMGEAARADEPKGRLAEMRESVERAARDELAWFVNAHVRERFSEQEKRMGEMLRRAEAAERLHGRLADLGVNCGGGDWRSTLEAERQIDRLAGVIDPNLERNLRSAAMDIARVADNIAEITKKKIEAA